MPVQEQAVIEGWRGVCVAMGLASPASRALCAAMTVGVASYAIKLPVTAYRQDGSVRGSDFFLIPLGVGTAVYLFT